MISWYIKNTFLPVWMLVLLILFVHGMTVAGGQPELVVGDRLSPEEIRQMGQLQTVKIDGMRFRIIPGMPDASETLLLNNRGVVGSSRHEITIRGLPEAEVQGHASQVVPQPVSVHYLEPTGIVVLTYADFFQTLEAWKALRQRLPDTAINLSLRFDRKRTQ